MPQIAGKPKNSIKKAMARARLPEFSHSIKVKRGVLNNFFAIHDLNPGQSVVFEGKDYKFVQRTSIGQHKWPTDIRVVFSHEGCYFAVYWMRSAMDCLPNDVDVTCYEVKPSKGGMYYD